MSPAFGNRRGPSAILNLHPFRSYTSGGIHSEHHDSNPVNFGVGVKDGGQREHQPYKRQQCAGETQA
jgi:hypothetical protein